MIFVRAATRNDVNLHWLRSEWWRLPFELQTESSLLINDPDPNDPVQNEARSRILHACRSAILADIPADARYRYGRIEEDDLPDLFILTCWDWFLDTGRTFELANTLTHLEQERGGLINGRLEDDVTHVDKVKGKIPYIRDYDPDVSNEYLILVATDETGPYTIIDGTHRAAALLIEHQKRPNTPWNAILIDSARMTTYRWHIGFADATQILSVLADLADRGAIW